MVAEQSISPDSIEIDADRFYASVLFPATSTLHEFVSRDQVYMLFCLLISTLLDSGFWITILTHSNLTRSI